MSRTLSGTDTGLSGSGSLVGEGELTEVPADHVELDFNRDPMLSIIDGHNVTDHLGHDDAVPQMGFYRCGLLSGQGVLFGFFAFQIESGVLVLELYISMITYFLRIFSSAWHGTSRSPAPESGR